MSALLSFLGGSAFRAVWGEFSSWMNKRQEHRYEIERMQLQGKLDTDTHARNMESQRLQAELGIKTIEVKSEADQAILAAEAFRDAMKQAAVPTGIVWVDAWNGSVRFSSKPGRPTTGIETSWPASAASTSRTGC
jgi:S-formylglutathione hydrolase FrmB